MWILIVTIIGYGSGGPVASAVAEFNTKDACITAAKEWENRVYRAKEYHKTIAICTPKG